MIKSLFIIAIFIGVIVATAFFLLRRGDMTTIANFEAAYSVYDQDPTIDNLSRLDLSASSFRVSSLIKNDGLLISLAHNIGNLADEEFNSQLSSDNRKAAFERFEALLH